MLKGLFLLFTLATGSAVFANDTPPGWYNDYSSARAVADQAHKPLFIVFSLHHCPPCQLLRDYIYPTQAFKDATKNMVLAYLDGDAGNNGQIAQSFGVNIFPSFRFVFDGVIVHQTTGRIPTVEAALDVVHTAKLRSIEHLKAVLDKNPGDGVSWRALGELTLDLEGGKYKEIASETSEAGTTAFEEGVQALQKAQELGVVWEKNSKPAEYLAYNKLADFERRVATATTPSVEKALESLRQEYLSFAKAFPNAEPRRLNFVDYCAWSLERAQGNPDHALHYYHHYNKYGRAEKDRAPVTAKAPAKPIE